MDKTILTILGVVFLAIGFLGFFNDPLLGIFAVDPLHNTIHILSGVLAFIAVGKGREQMRTYARMFGVAYGLIVILGFLVPGDMILGLFASNMADDILHLVIAVTFLYVGYGRAAGRNNPMDSAL